MKSKSPPRGAEGSYSFGGLGWRSGGGLLTDAVEVDARQLADDLEAGVEDASHRALAPPLQLIGAVIEPDRLDFDAENFEACRLNNLADMPEMEEGVGDDDDLLDAGGAELLEGRLEDVLGVEIAAVLLEVHDPVEGKRAPPEQVALSLDALGDLPLGYRHDGAGVELTCLGVRPVLVDEPDYLVAQLSVHGVGLVSRRALPVRERDNSDGGHAGSFR